MTRSLTESLANTPFFSSSIVRRQREIFRKPGGDFRAGAMLLDSTFLHARRTMRLCVFALLLCAGPVAFSQSAPSNPDRFRKFPLRCNMPGRDLNKLPGQWSSLRTMPFGRMHLPSPKPAARLDDAAIDPKIIVHPTAQNIGTQPPGALVAQNLYPELRFQPIDESKPRPRPLAIVWPQLKMELVGKSAPVSAGAQGR